VEVVDVQDLELGNADIAEALDVLLGDLLVAVQDDLAGLLVEDVLGRDFADQVLALEGQAPKLRRAHALDDALGKLATLANDDLTVVGVDDVLARALSGEQVVVDAALDLPALRHVDRLFVVVEVEEFLGAVAQGAKQHRGVQLAATIDADVEVVFVVELEVEPATAIGDHAR